MNSICIDGIVDSEIRVNSFQGSKGDMVEAASFKLKNVSTNGKSTIYVGCEGLGWNADRIKSLRKGSRVVVEGVLNVNSYVDEAGNKRYFPQIKIKQITFMGQSDQRQQTQQQSRPQYQQQQQRPPQQPQPQYQPPQQEAPPEEDDVPF